MILLLATVQQVKFDAVILHQHKKRQEEKMFDAGDGKIDIWRVENFKLVPQPKELLGTFFGGDCYVILYTYQKDKREYYLIYYWLVSTFCCLFFSLNFCLSMLVCIHLSVPKVYTKSMKAYIFCVLSIYVCIF